MHPHKPPKKDFSEQDLSGKDFSNGDYRDYNFQGSKLAGVNFTQAKLNNANFQGADLRGAELTHTDLRGVQFYQANLQGADLTHANLRGADLRNANLQDANLTDADFSGADVLKAELTGSKGLAKEMKKDLKKKGAIFNKLADQPQDYKWWIQYVIVPIIVALIGSGGMIAILSTVKSDSRTHPSPKITIQSATQPPPSSQPTPILLPRSIK